MNGMEDVLRNASYQFGECPNIFTVNFVDGKATQDGIPYEIVVADFAELEDCDNLKLAAVLIGEGTGNERNFTLFAFRHKNNTLRLVSSVFLGRGKRAGASVQSGGIVHGEILSSDGSSIEYEVDINCNYFELATERS